MIAGIDSFYVLTEDDQLYSCGSGDLGQLGLENNNDTSTLTKINFDWKIKSMIVGDLSLYVLTEEGRIYSCGHN